MGYRVKGTLKLPDGTPANNAEIEFISRKNFSPLVRDLKSNIKCSATGAYDVTLEYGEYAVVIYPGGTYPAALGTVILAADTVVGQDLPTLLQQAGWQPATPEYIQQIAAWLVEANSSATAAKASQDAAKVSETNAAASASAAANAIVTHEGKAGAHPISGVAGLQAALDGKYSPANKPTAADIQNVVSPVSSGGIIERGYNANGEYVKFADGTMICTATKTFAAPSARLNYATQFVASPALVASAISGGTAYATVAYSSTTEYIVNVFNSAGAQFTCDGFITSVGRWK